MDKAHEYSNAISDAVASEREECARLVERMPELNDAFLRRIGKTIAAKIRASGAK